MKRKALYINCSLLLLAFVLTGTYTVFAQDEEYAGMKGTDTPEFQESTDAGKCLVFSKYVVKTIQGEDVGEKIAVYKREASADAESACQTADEAHLNVDDSENYFFYGLSGSLLFIDSGTSVESRGLEIYNLNSRKSVFNESYTGDPSLTGGRFVLFDSPTDRKGPAKSCKQAAKWKRDGGGVGWVQGKKLDLQTSKLTNAGALRCVYMQ